MPKYIIMRHTAFVAWMCYITYSFIYFQQKKHRCYSQVDTKKMLKSLIPLISVAMEGANTIIPSHSQMQSYEKVQFSYPAFPVMLSDV